MMLTCLIGYNVIFFYITEENSTWQAEAATCTAKYDQYRHNVLVNSTLPTQILDVLQGSVSMMPVCLFIN